ncbi:MAG: response regulator [Pseudomonadota bacterium]
MSAANNSLRKRMLLGLIGLLGALMGLVALILFAVTSVGSKVEEISSKDLKILLVARENQDSFVQAAGALEVSVSTGEPSLFDEKESNFDIILKNLDLFEGIYQPLLNTDKEEFKKKIIHFKEYAKRYNTLSFSSPSQGELLSVGAKLADERRFIEDTLTQTFIRSREKVENELSSLGERSRIVLAISIAFALAIATLTTVMLFRGTNKFLRRLTRLTKHFSQTNLEQIEILSPDDQGDELAALLNVSNGMLSNMKKAKSELISFQFVEAVFDSLVEAVAVVRTKDQSLLLTNAALHRMLGIQGKSVSHDSDQDLCALMVQSGMAVDREMLSKLLVAGESIQLNRGQASEQRTYLGTSLLTKLNSEEVAIATFSDVTDLVRAQREKHDIELQLFHASKLSSLGTMGAGLAHELNNPLSSVIGFATMIQTKELSKERQLEVIAGILRNADRMKKVINHMRSFARNTRSETSTLTKIEDPIDNAFMILETQLKTNNISWKIIRTKDELFFNGDPTEFESVIQNLISNSRDAFLSQATNLPTDGRKIQLVIEQLLEKNGDEQIHIRYTDNAGGIPKAIMEKIFEPFFTTKEVGKGTGIGLAIAQRIVQENLGTISVSSPRIGETQFDISIPLAKKEDREHSSLNQIQPEIAATPSTNPPESRAPLGAPLKKYTVACVDDEPDLLELLSEILSDYFHVRAHLSSREFVDAVLADPPDIVLSDMRMPGLNGLEVIGNIRKKYPNLPALIVSGHAGSDQDSNRAFAAGAQAVLPKPLPDGEILYECLLTYINAGTKPVVSIFGFPNRQNEALVKDLESDFTPRIYEQKHVFARQLMIDFPRIVLLSVSDDLSWIKDAMPSLKSNLAATQVFAVQESTLSPASRSQLMNWGIELVSEGDFPTSAKLHACIADQLTKVSNLPKSA